MIKEGANTDGLYNYTKSFEMIEYLYKELNLDINKPYRGYYPIIFWSGMAVETDSDAMVRIELMNKLFKSNFKIDWSVKDKNGKTIK